jgi:tetratricopeptide (TPR) repeat protein
MKKTAILAALLLSTASFAAFADMPAQSTARPSMVVVAPAAQQADPAMEKVAHLQSEWARIKYQVAKGQQEAEMSKLSAEAAGVVQAYPDRAEPKIWNAIILSTEAGFTGGLSALPKVKAAKKLLEESLKIDAKALEGSASTSLGSLYYQVPGWPLGFGDDDKAKKYLLSALAINPDGIDPNYFYGDYLVSKKKYSDAVPVLEKALKAADRPGREVADEGRRGEIRTLLETAKEKAGTKKSQFN